MLGVLHCISCNSLYKTLNDILFLFGLGIFTMILNVSLAGLFKLEAEPPVLHCKNLPLLYNNSALKVDMYIISTDYETFLTSVFTLLFIAPLEPAGCSTLCLTRHSMTPVPSMDLAWDPHFLSITFEHALLMTG